jgi:hypothetical protein
MAFSPLFDDFARNPLVVKPKMPFRFFKRRVNNGILDNDLLHRAIALQSYSRDEDLTNLTLKEDEPIPTVAEIPQSDRVFRKKQQQIDEIDRHPPSGNSQNVIPNF